MGRIITNGWPKDDEILLDEISCTYVQEPDCTEDRDGGGGKFINIQTKSWSITGEDFDYHKSHYIPLIPDFLRSHFDKDLNNHLKI